MKKLIYIFIFFITIGSIAYAQDNPQPDVGKLQQKLTEYIQDKLGLSKEEAQKFGPVFLNYFNELRKTNQEYKGDRLVLQQKIVELRLRYRDQFKPIIGEKRSNDVFIYEHQFVDEVKKVQQERLENRKEGPANKRFKMLQ
jgi:hypothetical protein